MVIVERKEEMRERMLGGPVPRRGQSMSHTPQYSRPTLHLRPFDHDHAHHVLNGYAYTKFAHQRRRPPHAQFEYPKASQQPCGPGASPDPTHQPNPVPPPVLAPRASDSRTCTPHSSSSRVRTRARPTTRGLNLACVRVPRRLPVVPASVHVVLCIGDWGCAHARSECKCQYHRA